MLKKLPLTVFILCLGLSSGAKDDIVRYDSARPVFAGKGTWSVGGTAAISASGNDNYTFVVVEGINSNGFRLSLAPEFCWFFADNVALGGKVGYNHTVLDAASGSINVSSISLGVKDYYIARQSLNLSAFLRYFIPIGESKRIAMYVDGGLQGVFGRGKDSEQHTGAVVGTWQKSWKVGFVVNPGIMAYILDDRLALFASLGIAGINYGRTNQIHNQVAEGDRDSFNFSFTLNPTALSVGLEFYIGRKK